LFHWREVSGFELNPLGANFAARTKFLWICFCEEVLHYWMKWGITPEQLRNALIIILVLIVY